MNRRDHCAHFRKVGGYRPYCNSDDSLWYWSMPPAEYCGTCDQYAPVKTKFSTPPSDGESQSHM